MRKRTPKAKRRRPQKKNALKQSAVRKERGIWVYHGEPSNDSIVHVIDRVREARIRELAG
jgi:hypothetical protein